MVRIYLQNPEINGKAPLCGTRVFALLINNEILMVAKVAKSFDPIASSNLLSFKINNDTIRNVESHHLFKQVLEESFCHGFKFELT